MGSQSSASVKLISHFCTLLSIKMSDPFPEIKSKHSLVAKYVTEPIWEKLNRAKTATSGFSLAKAIACAVEFNNQHCGIYAGDWDSYKVFSDVFDPLIQEYHGIAADSTHTSDMDASKIRGTISKEAPVHSTRIRVGRNIDGFGLSPGITKQQRIDVENLMKKAFANLKGDLAGSYFPLTGMSEKVRQQSVDDHFLFMSGDPNLKVAGMERDWPEASRLWRIPSRRNLVMTSCWTKDTDTSTPAQRTLEQACELLFISTSQDGPSLAPRFLLPDVKSFTFSHVEPEASLVDRLVLPTTSLTSTGWDTARCSWCKR